MLVGCSLECRLLSLSLLLGSLWPGVVVSVMGEIDLFEN